MRREAVNMNKKFLEDVKTRLAERRQEIVGDGRESPEKKDSRAKDTGDEALEISMEKLEGSMRATQMGELKLIDEALKRVELGKYGSCVDCESQISEKRLECFPYAARCIVCQERFEG